ncbi:PepSY domain-containing protein [Ornithinimicrobium flavum]|uniref:PepSY domain-containing protein n=1 Tax=Ornithinimicrobium flavum TaxID=1288636 RepID=UPI0010705DD3|nr:PepSY domain-containing protein [Ornithinimicrobium flavum]
MTKTTSLTIALALSATLGLAACGSDDDVTGPGVSAGTTDAVATADETGDDDSTGSDDPATGTTEGSTSGAVPPGAEDVTSLALAAVATAETETAGIAYEIDDQDDDGTWEVDVRAGDRSVEVTVSPDGTTVESTEEDDLDAEDRDALDAASITVVEAIEIAVGEVGGVLDDVELDEEDGTYAWEVTLDGTDSGDDVEVLVSVTGEVLRADA